MKYEKLELDENYVTKLNLVDEYGYIRILGFVKININGSEKNINVNSYVILNPYDSIKITALKDSKLNILRIKNKVFKEIVQIEPSILELFEVKSNINSRIFLSTSYSELVQDNLSSKLNYVLEEDVRLKNLLVMSYTTLLLCNIYSDILSSNSLSKTKIKLSVEYINDYFISNISDTKLDLTVIANHFNVSSNYLSTFYKNKTGKNLTQAIRNYRLELAIRYLKEGYKVVDIYNKVGYSTYNNFFKQFKKVYGVTPCEYLKSVEG